MKKQEELTGRFRIAYFLWVVQVILEPPEGSLSIKSYEGCTPEEMEKVYTGTVFVDIREVFGVLNGKAVRDPQPLLIGIRETVEDTMVMTFTPENRLAALLRIPAAVRSHSLTPEMKEIIQQLNHEVRIAGFTVKDIFPGYIT